MLPVIVRGVHTILSALQLMYTPPDAATLLYKAKTFLFFFLKFSISLNIISDAKADPPGESICY